MTTNIDSPNSFHRVLGPWSASALVAGSMIGTGIFFFVADVAARLHNSVAILACWLTGATVAACGALCLAELAAAYPHTGGIYVYLSRAFGPLTAFLYSWTKFLVMRVGSLGIPALAFASFFCDLSGLTSQQALTWKKPLAMLVIVLLTAINIIGVKISSRVQNLLTIIKIVCLVAMISVGVLYATGFLAEHPIQLSPRPAAKGNSVLLFLAALVPIMWTLGGWDESPFVAEEIQHPQRNLPLSILGGFGLVAGLYIVVNAAYLAILTPGEMAASQGRTATLAMQRAVGPAARSLLALGLMISTCGAAHGMTLTGARIAYATGREHPLFSWFAHLHPRTRTPVRSLLFQALLALLVVWQWDDPFSLLLYTGVAYWLFSGLMALAVIIMRRQDPGTPRPFRVWAYPFTPLFFMAAATGMVISVFVENWRNAMITVALLLVGVLVYRLQGRLERKPVITDVQHES